MQKLVADILLAGRTAWPEVELDEAAIAAHLKRVGPEDPPGHAADLFLAAACALGHRAALAIFERELVAGVPAFVARVDSSPVFAGEVAQLLREKLFVGDDAKIFSYKGRSALGGWVRVVAVRLAIDLQREQSPSAGTRAEDLAAQMSANDPDVLLLRGRYSDQFSAALKRAIAALSPKQRNLLRLHFFDGWNIDRIGLTYGVHRATAARWIITARQELLDAARSDLGARLQLSPSEFRSLALAVRSQLDLGWSEVLPAAG